MPNETEVLPVRKSEILFLYESTYSIPNGDPFTGEQRYDEETKRVLVSDVRIKRFIRDHLANLDRDSIYVLNDRANQKAGETPADPESGAAERFKSLSKKKSAEKVSERDFLKTLIDVRLFGGILTEKGKAINLTGPVQFALLNPSLNAVELRMHQNTSVFASSTSKNQGAIGTTTVVPYCLNQIHGWINPYSARDTNLTEADVQTMLRALWDSINNANTRTKSNQNSLLLIQIIYALPTKKLYGLDRSIKLNPNAEKRDEQIRNSDDYTLDFAKLAEMAVSDVVAEISFYSDSPKISEALNKLAAQTAKGGEEQPKIRVMQLFPSQEPK